MTVKEISNEIYRRIKILEYRGMTPSYVLATKEVFEVLKESTELYNPTGGVFRIFGIKLLVVFGIENYEVVWAERS